MNNLWKRKKNLLKRIPDGLAEFRQKVLVIVLEVFAVFAPGNEEKKGEGRT